MVAIGLPTISLRAQHDRVFAGGADAAAMEDLLNAVGRTGQKPGPSLNNAANVFRVKCVDVLEWID